MIYSLDSFGEKLLLQRYKDKNSGMARICKMAHQEGEGFRESRASKCIQCLPATEILRYRNTCAKWCGVSEATLALWPALGLFFYGVALFSLSMSALALSFVSCLLCLEG